MAPEAARHALVRERAGLELVGQVLARRPHLVAEGFRQQVLAAPEHALVRAEPLVGRGDHDVGAKILHVDGIVGRELHGIEIDDGAGRPGLRREALRVVDRAGAVGGHAHGHKPGPVAQHLGQGIVGKLVGARVEVHPAHRQAKVLGQQQPGRHIGVVVHARQHDLVALAELAAQAARHVEGERRHVLPEDDLRGRGRIVEVGAGAVRLIHQFAGRQGGREVAAQIGIAVDQAVHRPVHHLLRDLGSGRVVEIDPGPPRVGEGKGGEVPARLRGGEIGLHAGKFLKR